MLFQLDQSKKLRILEIGCGPGALAEALHRWYPNAEIVAIDRDSNFIKYAKENIPGVNFIEGDATALPFEADTFDVTISNTVCEHIEPTMFYAEQKRVLKENGMCLALSARKGDKQWDTNTSITMIIRGINKKTGGQTCFIRHCR